MHFDDLKQYYLEGGEAKLLSAENKQRINLSGWAHSVLLRDMDQFLGNGQSMNTKVNSTMVNRVFRLFRGNAKASIAHSCRRKREELQATLRSINPEARDAAVELLLTEYRKELQTYVEELLTEKGWPVSIRISDDNLLFLGCCDPTNPAMCETGQQEGKYYNCKVGAYMKAVLEEYAQKSTVEREKIFFSDIIQDIRNAMDAEVILKLHRRNGVITYIKPYKLLEDIDHQHFYLAGYGANQKEGPWHTTSVRITNVESCSTLVRKSFLSKADISALESAINEDGVQFLSEDHEKKKTIVVQFTPAGEKLFRKVLHLRPKLESYDPATRIGQFHCTISQAEFYFLRFADKVKILEPKNLGKHLHQAHRAAADQYE